MIGYKSFFFGLLLTGAVAIGAQVATAPAPANEAAATVPAAADSPASADAAPANAQTLARGTPIPPAELEAFVDGYLRRAMANEHIAGATVSIVQNDRTVLLKGYGLAGIDPVRPVDPRKTLFRIGSLSKTMTWTLIMREVEKGRLKLIDPINQHLPPELQIPDQGFKNPIRIVDLMAHAPGMEDVSAGHLFVDTPERIIPPAQYLAKHRPDRVREPGLISSYSNYGLVLAGEILARLNGVDFETLADRDIFGPLKMTHSTFREPYEPRQGIPQPMPKALADERSSGFRWKGGRFEPTTYDYITQVAAAGSISTTAEDMTRYMRMHLRNGTLDGVSMFGPQTAQLFRTPIMNVPEGSNGWAHGMIVNTLPGGFKGYGHGGGTSSFFTYMDLIPDLDLGIFISTNTQGGFGVAVPLSAAIVNRFYVGEAPMQRPGDKALAARAADYEGLYVNTRRAYSGLEGFMGLLGGVSKVSVTPEGYLITSGGGSPRAWVPAGKPGQFRAAVGDDYLNFGLDDKGKAKIYYQLASGFERSGPLMNPSLLTNLAILTLITSFGLWVAFLARRATTSPVVAQRRSHHALLAAGAFWLIAMGLFFLLLSLLPDMNDKAPFPPTLLMLSSLSALLATIATIAALVLMIIGLRRTAGDRAGWTTWAVVRHALAILLFLALAFVVGMRGGLLPWM
ncbi:serine hydrolase domain-containing protein [Sphingosinicella rhizophila]|uniref:Serine hydrolase domain-containing protein n=1 Tax=Sphingosinicella rhizophila TaxID=3050082 RepID=A0ABU3Q9A6_9SPHN|nr:serine hydrolase domain-containing protein [Sphingosinicella sp. GR2756]MDT9599977.1 serine hydrolase domain-containing protein [Sphingosinicella sp. GR2756]